MELSVRAVPYLLEDVWPMGLETNTLDLAYWQEITIIRRKLDESGEDYRY